MRGHSPTDTQLLLDLVGEAYSFEDLTQFRSEVLEVLNRVAPSDRVAYNEISVDQTFAVTVPDQDASLLPIFTAHVHEHPLISRVHRTGDGRPYRISDMIDQKTFHASALYNEFYRHMGIESQVGFTLRAPPHLLVGLALNREQKDYTDREVQLLARARPHLMQAYRNAELWGARAAILAALEQGIDTLGRHVIVADSHGQVEFATDGARRLLDGSSAARGLPQELREWISGQRSPVAERRGSRAAAEPFVLVREGGNVFVRLLRSRRDDGREVLLLEGGAGQLSVAALRGLGLTARQAETLRCVALGATPSQAATQLGISARTVEKHLERIYAKLGVSSLARAVAGAWAAVGVDPQQLSSPLGR